MSSSLDKSELYSKAQLNYFKAARIPLRLSHNPSSVSQPAANHESILPDLSYEHLKANLQQSKIRKKKQALVDSLHEQLEQHSIQHQQYIEDLKRKSKQQEESNNKTKQQHAEQILLLKLQIERLTKLSHQLIAQIELIKREKNLLENHYQHQMKTHCFSIRYELEDQIKEWKKEAALQLTTLKNKHSQALLQAKGENLKQREELRQKCITLEKNLQKSSSCVIVSEHKAKKLLQLFGQEDMPPDLPTKIDVLNDITLDIFRQIEDKAAELTESSIIIQKLKKQLEITSQEIERIKNQKPVIQPIVQQISNPMGQQASQELQQKYTQLQLKNTQAQHRYKDLEQRHSQLEQRHSNLQQKHTQLQQKLNELTRQLQRCQQQCSYLEGINTQLKEEIQALRVSNANSASTSDTVKVKDNNQIQDIRNMFHYDDTLRGLKQTIQLQQQELAERNERIGLLQTRVDELTANIAQLNESHQRKVRDIFQAVGSSGASAKEVNDLTQAYEKQIDLYGRQQSRLKEQMRKMKEQLNQVRLESETKTEQLQLLKTDYENVCQVNIEKNKMIEQLERELDDKKVAMDAMVNMFEQQMRHNKPS